MMRLVSLLICLSSAFAKVVDFEKDGGAKAGDYSWDTVWKNGAALNTSLQSLAPGDTFVVPNKTFAIMGGIKVQDLASVTIQIDGTIEFASTILNAEKYLKKWPRNKNGGVHECLQFDNLTDVKFTSTNIGMLNGAGAKWWGIPGIGYITRKENRPRLLKIQNSRRILIEKLFLKDSPYWTFLGSGIKGLEVRHSQIDARRDSSDSHDIVDLTAFNTDGFDLGSCDDVWIHDCSVWNQDDCFDVKDGTSNVVIERVNASGLGLTVGSIASTVRNLTFRDSYMHHTYKGIYMKFRGDGLIADVTYENIVIDAPEQWAIWIGPAQQCDGCSATNICSTDGGPCSICWPTFPGSQCHAPSGGKYVNITLRNITINNPKGSPGVLLANTSVPMENVVFDNVVVNNPGKKPWGDKYYHCENVNGVATGKTWPVPPCFHDLTSSNASGNAHGSIQA
jgi:polygalacturonase